MADQNCAHFECNCKVEQAKAYPRARTLTVAIVAQMLHRWLQTNASVGTQVARKLSRGMAVLGRHPCLTTR
jgi:hypothetical protein